MRSDLTEGVAVSFAMRPDGNPSRPMQNVKIVAELLEDLSQDWEIAGATAYILVGSQRHESNFEGPYLQETNDHPSMDVRHQDTVCWHMYRTDVQPYEIDILLHRKSERLNFQETKELVENHGALRVTFRSFVHEEADAEQQLKEMEGE